MVYSMLVVSIFVVAYNYKKLIVNDYDVKTFIVISVMIIIAILNLLFINKLKDYSLVKILKALSEFMVPWFIKFMESKK